MFPTFPVTSLISEVSLQIWYKLKQLLRIESSGPAPLAKMLHQFIPESELKSNSIPIGWRKSKQRKTPSSETCRFLIAKF